MNTQELRYSAATIAALVAVVVVTTVALLRAYGVMRFLW